MPKSRLTWFPEMDQALRSLRERNVPFLVCADKIGVCYNSARKRATQLGLKSNHFRAGNGRFTIDHRSLDDGDGIEEASWYGELNRDEITL